MRTTSTICVCCLLLSGAGLSGTRAQTPPQWQQAAGYRYAPLAVPPGGKAGFTLIAPEKSGLLFTNQLSEEAVAKNRILENGSGAALGDVDGDGWCDIYFCGLEGANMLFRNRGDWKFENITAAAGVACPDQYSTGAALVDADGDGDLDLLVNAIGGGTRLFLNDGRAHFTEVEQSGLARRFGSASMAFADIDGDGDLELYVANYRTTTIKDAPPGVKPETRVVNGQVVVTPEDRFVGVTAKNGAQRIREIGEPDILYVNKGAGRFGPISWTGGAFVDEDERPLTTPPRDWGLSVMFRDLNKDGTPDIYVCNDFFYSPDRVWLNEGGRRFRAMARLALRNMSMSSMAVDFADIDRDGDDDFFVADMLSRDREARHRQRANTAMMREVHFPVNDPAFRPEVIRNTLYLNRGDGTYAEIALYAGIAASDWTWSVAFLDVDLDGYEDLLIANGNFHDVLDADSIRATATPNKSHEQHLADLKKFPKLRPPNIAFRNRGDLTFEDASAAWGFDTPGISHGMAMADLDHDGDLDVAINNLNAPAGLYRNNTSAPRIAVRLKGLPPNTRGIGAKIKVTNGPVAQSQEVIAGGRYLSCDEAARVFAASPEADHAIEVIWRNGTRSVVPGARANHLYEIDEAGSNASPPVSAPTTAALFEDASQVLNHQHREEAFDDFQRQPLLPFKLSELGPAVCWTDLDNDGWDDLVVGSGKGGALARFRNDGKGGFTPMPQSELSRPAARDHAGILGTGGKLLVAFSNYEMDGVGSEIHSFAPGQSIPTEQLTFGGGSLGPMALADIDGDGDLDLFAGSRVVPGRWPEASASAMFKSEGGRFQPDTANRKAFENVGLVSGAVFSDLDSDGFPELILASHWAPVRVFKNERGAFTEKTAELGLAAYVGWWNSVTTADLDADGRLDIIAGNWGLNNPFKASPAQPARVFFGDLQGRKAFDIIEAEYSSTGREFHPMRPLDLMAAALPRLRERYPTHRAFAASTVQQIAGFFGQPLREVQATTFESMVFFNRSGKFTASALPREAQFSPSFGLTAADFDGDGAVDLFLAQNFFGTQLEIARFDAGRGLLLKNDGKGALQPLSGDESGLKIYGEQRGAAASDFNQDGRVDLVVAQNSGPAKLYINRGSEPCLRVKLAGGPGNPSAIGAALRLKSGERWGPSHEVHAGSGYWSQDSSAIVLAAPPEGTKALVQIRWPGGKVTDQEVAPGALNLEIKQPGL